MAVLWGTKSQSVPRRFWKRPISVFPSKEEVHRDGVPIPIEDVRCSLIIRNSCSATTDLNIGERTPPWTNADSFCRESIPKWLSRYILNVPFQSPNRSNRSFHIWHFANLRIWNGINTLFFEDGVHTLYLLMLFCRWNGLRNWERTMIGRVSRALINREMMMMMMMMIGTKRRERDILRIFGDQIIVCLHRRWPFIYHHFSVWIEMFASYIPCSHCISWSQWLNLVLHWNLLTLTHQPQASNNHGVIELLQSKSKANSRKEYSN